MVIFNRSLPVAVSVAFYLLVILLLNGCTLPGMKSPTIEGAADLGLKNVSLIELNATNAVAYSTRKPRSSFSELHRAAGSGYLVGAYDVLDIIIWGRPELNNPGGVTQRDETSGRTVRADGTIFFPFVGVLRVEGQTVEQIRRKLAKGLRAYIKNPQVDVRVLIHQARKFYVTGEVRNPGIQAVESQPKSLLDAISAAGGMTENADLSTVVLNRNGRQYSIDLEALYAQGDVSQNVRLQPGDTIHIPDNDAKKVFVMGEVETQTMLPMRRGKLTLAEALAGVEGINLEFANASGVYVLRRNQDSSMENPSVLVFQLNAKSPEAILVADQFALQSRDVVFVSTLSLTRWNRVVTQILPTIQTIFQTDAVINRSR